MGNLRGYVNKVNNSNKIYTREDIGAMSQGDYAANEKAIDYQLKTIGVPTQSDLQNSADVVYVHAYTKKDGTKVTDYYRSKPDGGCFGTGTPPTSPYPYPPTEPPTSPPTDPTEPPYPTYPPTDTTKNPTDPTDPTTYAKNSEDLLSALFDFFQTGNVEDIGKVLTSIGIGEPIDEKDKKSKDKTDDTQDGFLELFKALDEITNSLLLTVVHALPQDSIVTDIVKGLVQYKINMCQTLETLMDPVKGPEMVVSMIGQWISTFADFTKKLVTGDIKDINLTEVCQNLRLDQLAYLINPLAGVVATMAIDVAPKVIGIIDASKTGDKETMVNDALGAFTNCMGVIGQLKGIVGDKIAGFSKDVSAEIYNDTTQTYDNLTQLQDAGYKYEKFVSADMLDEANQEALKLNNVSVEMLQGQSTGFASDIKPDSLLSNNMDSYSPSQTTLKGGVSFFDDAIKNNPEIGKKVLDAGIPAMNALSGNNLNDSKGLWESASQNFQNTDYINKNADVVNSVSDFGNNMLEKQISNKLQSQFGIKDAKGLVFYPDSELSTEMSNSQEMGNFLDKNKDILNSGQIIKNSSVSFNSDKDLFYGIHNADVLNAQINKNGDFQAVVLDTYDFNKDSTNPLVQMARSAQDAKKLTPYYTINFIYIPKEKLPKH